MASSAAPLLAGTTTPSKSNYLGLRHVIVPLSNLKVTKFNPLKLKMEERENEGFCVSSMSVGVKSRFGSLRGGGAVLERPTFDQSQFDPSTQVQEGGDIGRVRDKRSTGSGDSYRVLLLDDERHSEKLVLKVLPQAVPSVTPDDARRIFSESRQNGVAVVIVTVKEHAEFYSQMMIRGGLLSSIEPDSQTV
ncbi:ATP-dependent Clp protease adapter protein CLPS2, chloroplastic [Beta vulgaris subsp. vulgaris]|uniref:ATP-dependent Clp protease adapter protein CLPS2, chloroplastic n=1 Tax=Beta vulgaris subsp. vulgaris TaxID=3555 RepID=UPI002036E2C8|nr:ATP-dependent Clp protease adapter protein CLPS2, chloroplastic [Beta vulgaris subsp. vulgaris]